MWRVVSEARWPRRSRGTYSARHLSETCLLLSPMESIHCRGLFLAANTAGDEEPPEILKPVMLVRPVAGNKLCLRDRQRLQDGCTLRGAGTAAVQGTALTSLAQSYQHGVP